MNMKLYAGSSEGDAYSHYSWLLWDDPHSFTVVLENMLEKMNEDVCIC